MTFAAALRLAKLQKSVNGVPARDAHNVLSLGRRCMEEGCGFHGSPYRKQSSMAPFKLGDAGERVQVWLHVQDCGQYVSEREGRG